MINAPSFTLQVLCTSLAHVHICFLLLSHLCLHCLPSSGAHERCLGNLHKADRIYIDIKLFLQGDVDLAENLTGELRASLTKLKCIKTMPQME